VVLELQLLAKAEEPRDQRHLMSLIGSDIEFGVYFLVTLCVCVCVCVLHYSRSPLLLLSFSFRPSLLHSRLTLFISSPFIGRCCLLVTRSYAIVSSSLRTQRASGFARNILHADVVMDLRLVLAVHRTGV